MPGPAAAPGTTVQPEPSGVSEQSGFWDPLRGRAGPPADDNVWVTVFGFQPSQLQLVMREFAKCGDIVHVGNGREDSANWVHIQYAVCPARALKPSVDAAPFAAPSWPEHGFTSAALLRRTSTAHNELSSAMGSW